MSGIKFKNRYFVVKDKRMTITRIKESLHDLIDRIEDKELLTAYHKIIEKGLSTSNDLILGYNTNGEIISKSHLIQQVTAASQRVKSGQYTSQEELEKESENW